jgi:radical SAM superfamily enzyme YgiQ (UPF0313 family)
VKLCENTSGVKFGIKTQRKKITAPMCSPAIIFHSMHYEGNIIRPPSEADSILLQVTTGCSHNKCSFCGVYRDTSFTIKDDTIIQEDIRYAARHFRNHRTLFLCDGDALIIPFARLFKLLTYIRENLPWVTRVGTYANAKSISRKSQTELVALKDVGLKIIHMGLESGDDFTLQQYGKWGDAETIIEQGKKVKGAGIRLFVTVITGLAGKERSLIHAKNTGMALTKMNPDYIGALSLMPFEGTILSDRIAKGNFTLMESIDILHELRTMLQYTDIDHGLFYANHASNYLPLRARLPRDKEKTLAMIDSALQGNVALTPEWLRGL